MVHITKRLWAPLLLAVISLSAYTINDAHLELISKLGMFMATILFAGWAASVMPVEEFLENFYKLACGVAVFQLAAYPFLIHFSHLYDSERQTFLGDVYAGLFAHKNHAGSFFALSILVGLNKLTNNLRKSITNIVVLYAQLLGLVLCLILSGAATNLVSCFIAYCLVIPLGLMRKKPLLSAVMFFIVIVGSLFSFIFAEDILSILGRDVGFTGRDVLYANWSTFFLRKPFLGYGYSEFFSNLTDSPSYELNDLIKGGEFVTFESGYLQIAIDFGGFGFVLYIYIIARSLFYSFKFLRVTMSEQRNALIQIMICIIFTSFTNNYISLHNSLYLAFLFYVYFEPKSGALGKAGLLGRRMRAPSSPAWPSPACCANPSPMPSRMRDYGPSP